MTTKTQDRASAIERLRVLPPVFKGSDLSLRFGWTPDEAGQYLLRWKHRDLVRPTGPRAGVYFNLICESSAPETRREEAIATLLPSALAIGATVLHEAGWTTQIPTQLNIAALRRRTFPLLNGVVVFPRGIGWYRLAHSWLRRSPGRTLPRVDAAFALADALKMRDGWVPDPDDIDFPEAEDVRRFLEACQALGMSLAAGWLEAIRLATGEAANRAS